MENNDDLWQRLLRESLTILALPPDEQIRINGPGPGCLACDLLNDFDHARRVAMSNACETISEEQRGLLESINDVMGRMEQRDFECFDNEVVRRPIWQQLSELAARALKTFGWEGTTVQPFVEVKAGVWQRPSN